MPLPDSVLRELWVIDRALAGAAVAPDDAELAETALLLAADRPRLDERAAARMDARVAALAPPAGRAPASRFRRWLARVRRPAWSGGLLTAAVASVVAVLVVTGRPLGPGSAVRAGVGSSAPVTRTPSTLRAGHAPGVTSAAAAVGTAASSPAVAGPAAKGPLRAAPPPALTVPRSLSPSAQNPEGLSPYIPAPVPNGRRIVHSAQLDLTAPAGRIGQVAQELFFVVGSEQGVVEHSQVTSGDGGYASFTLSIPTLNLSATLARLAQLRGATVASSTATTQDVNSTYLDEQRALADARTLRASLLRKLAGALALSDIEALKGRIAGVESQIAVLEAQLNGLAGRLSFSSVDVSITPGPGGGPGVPGGGGGAGSGSLGGLSLHRALHDAVVVLRTVAGIGLIALAVLVPLALVVLLGTLAFRLARGRARERALDGA